MEVLLIVISYKNITKNIMLLSCKIRIFQAHITQQPTSWKFGLCFVYIFIEDWNFQVTFAALIQVSIGIF